LFSSSLFFVVPELAADVKEDADRKFGKYFNKKILQTLPAKRQIPPLWK